MTRNTAEATTQNLKNVEREKHKHLYIIKMIVRFKKLVENAVIPTKAHPTDAGADLTATSKTMDSYGNVVYGIGLAMEIPEGYAGFIFPRSSNAKFDLRLTNCVGVIDA